MDKQRECQVNGHAWIKLCVALLTCAMLFTLTPILQIRAESTSQITVQEAFNVRVKPIINSTKLGILYPGDKVQLLDTVSGDRVAGYGDQWYKISFHNQEGYLIKSTVGQTIQVTKKEDVKKQQYLYVQDEFHLRSKPSIHSDILGTTTYGTKLPLKDKVKGEFVSSYGDDWYQVEWKGGLAYIIVDENVQIVSNTPTTNADTMEDETDSNKVLDESLLDKQAFVDIHTTSTEWINILNQFPRSYRNALNQLHKKYPNWIFVPQKINASLSDVINGELEVEQRNLVPSSSEYRDYIKNNTVYDAGGWVPINKKGLAYLLDPRNYLNERYIFAFENYLVNNESEQSVRSMFKTYNPNNQSLMDMVPNIMLAAQETNMNPLFLASKIVGEVVTQNTVVDSAKGERVVDGKAGFYNVYNIGAYAGAEPRDHAVRFAMGNFSSEKEKVAYDLPWDTQKKAIVGGAKWILDFYGKAKQHTPYYQKFNVINLQYYKQYMQNAFAPKFAAVRSYTGYRTAGELSGKKVFSIPVYADMQMTNAKDPSSKFADQWFDTALETPKSVEDVYYAVLPEGKKIDKDVDTRDKTTVKEDPEQPNDHTDSDVSTPSPEPKMGDVDGNGVINILDMIYQKNHIEGRRLLSEAEFKRADIDKNHVINVLDMQMVKNHIEGRKLIED